jgi:hypothetical protein
VKNIWSKKRLLWVFWGVLGLGLVAAGYIQEVDASNTAKKGKQWPTTVEYFLLRDLVVDTTNDRILTIAGLRQPELAISEGGWDMNNNGNWRPFCASKCNANPCDDFSLESDTTFPNTGTYYSAFTLILNRRNLFASRIPKGFYIKASARQQPGKLFTTMTLLTDAYNDGVCHEIVNSQTWTFRKYRANKD